MALPNSDKLKQTRLIRLEFGLGGLALVGLGLWLWWRLLDGTLAYYLHPRFNLLVGASGLILIGLGGWQLRWSQSQSQARAGRSEVVLVGLLALAGLLVTPHPLENVATGGSPTRSGPVSTRLLTEALQKQDWQNAATLDTRRWSVLDWSAALNDSDRAEKLIGQPVDLTGFVVRPAGAGGGTFWLARYVVVCCTADSTALRLAVSSPASSGLEDNQWMRVQGSLGRNSAGTISFLADRVDRVARPTQPYIYP